MDRILVVYASGAGSTAEVAEEIGKVLREQGATVDVRPTDKAGDLSDYGAVIVGSAIRAGHLLPAAASFVHTHRAALSKMRVAYFVVCLTMQAPTEANCKTVAGYVEELRLKVPQVNPVDAGLFAGKLDYGKLPLPLRLILKAMKMQAGDFRDWEAVRAWAVGVLPKLKASHSN